MQTNGQIYREERRVIQPNPLLKTLRSTGWISLAASIVLGAVVLLEVVGLIVTREPNLSKPIISGLFIFLINLLNAILFRAQRRYWEIIEVQRFAAVQRDRSPLLPEQPIPNPVALELPIVIKVRQPNRYYLVVMGAILLFALCFAVYFTWIVGSFNFSASPLVNFLFIFLIITGLMIGIIIFLNRQRIEITEGGIIFRSVGRTEMVAWQEASLLACYPAFGLMSRDVKSFELSSATGIVRWFMLPPSSGRSVGHQEEYNRQMQSLLSLIAARTELPLFEFKK